MTYADALQRVLDLLDRAMDLIENVDWDTEDDPDPGEEDIPEDEDENKIVAIGGAR